MALLNESLHVINGLKGLVIQWKALVTLVYQSRRRGLPNLLQPLRLARAEGGVKNKCGLWQVFTLNFLYLNMAVAQPLFKFRSCPISHCYFVLPKLLFFIIGDIPMPAVMNNTMS